MTWPSTRSMERNVPRFGGSRYLPGRVSNRGFRTHLADGGEGCDERDDGCARARSRVRERRAGPGWGPLVVGPGALEPPGARRPDRGCGVHRGDRGHCGGDRMGRGQPVSAVASKRGRRIEEARLRSGARGVQGRGERGPRSAGRLFQRGERRAAPATMPGCASIFSRIPVPESRHRG